MKEYQTRNVESFYPGKPKKIGNLDFEYKKEFDARAVDKICGFIQENTVTPDYWAGVAVGISDGLDGATAAALSLKALGKERVTAVIVNVGDTREHKEQTELAIRSAQALGVTYEVFNASKIYQEFQKFVKERGPFTDVNVSTRIIQDIIFQVADEKNYAVVSTINKSEILTGRIMEYFYGHIAPLTGLFKTEIFDLAKILEVPGEIIARKPGGIDTWYDEDTFGVTYDTLDKVLYLLTVKNMTPKEIAKKYNSDEEWVKKLQVRTTHRFWRLATKDLCF